MTVAGIQTGSGLTIWRTSCGVSAKFLREGL